MRGVPRPIDSTVFAYAWFVIPSELKGEGDHGLEMTRGGDVLRSYQFTRKVVRDWQAQGFGSTQPDSNGSRLSIFASAQRRKRSSNGVLVWLCVWGSRCVHPVTYHWPRRLCARPKLGHHDAKKHLDRREGEQYLLVKAYCFSEHRNRAEPMFR